MTPEEYGRSFDDRIAAILPEASRRAAPLRERLEAAGLRPEELTDGRALARLPVLSKDELLELQAAARPFGGLLTDGARLRRIFQSPGPLYEPELDQPDHWRWAPALAAAGFEAGDVVFNAFSYHLSPAGAMFEEGARALGCAVLPGGVGNLELQLQACADAGATAYVGLPSYLKALLEKGDEEGVKLSLRRAFVTAEPLPPSLRAWLQERVPVVLQGYGTAEAGNLGYECEQAEGLHVPEDALVEVCELSSGEPLWDGAVGQVVATVLSADYPLVRLGTGDLSAYLTESCRCGRGTPRLKGWLGRVGDAVKVRGMFLHPRQIEQVMGSLEGIARYRFVIERVEHRDELRCEVVVGPGADAEAVADAVRNQIRSGLRFNVGVTAVDELEEGAPLVEDRRTWE